MAELPTDVRAYKRTPVFTEDNVPSALLKDHKTKVSVWGFIHVLSGRLRYVVPSMGTDTILDPETDGVVEPTVPHRVAPRGAVSFYIEFFK